MFIGGCGCCGGGANCDCECSGATAPTWGRPADFMLRVSLGSPTSVTGATLSSDKIAAVGRLCSTNVCMKCAPCSKCIVQFSGSGDFSAINSQAYGGGYSTPGCGSAAAYIQYTSGAASWSFSYSAGMAGYAGMSYAAGSIASNPAENFCDKYTKLCSRPSSIELTGVPGAASSPFTVVVNGGTTGIPQTTIVYGNAKFYIDQCCAPCDCPSDCGSSVPESVVVSLNADLPEGGNDILTSALNGIAVACDLTNGTAFNSYFGCGWFYRGVVPVDSGNIVVECQLLCDPITAVPSPAFGAGFQYGLLRIYGQYQAGSSPAPFAWFVAGVKVTYLNFWFTGLKADIDIPDPDLCMSSICRNVKTGEYDASLAQDFGISSQVNYSTLPLGGSGNPLYYPKATITVSVP